MGKYHISIRVLHWLMALLVICTIALGFLMDSPNLYGIHKSIGVTLLILLSLRILSRLRTKSPEIPSEIKSVERRLAKLGHFALYSLLLLMPVSGWLMSNFAGYPVKLWGMATFTVVEKNKEFAGIANEVHEYLAYALIAMIVLHVVGFLKHLIVDKLNLLRRIL